MIVVLCVVIMLIIFSMERTVSHDYLFQRIDYIMNLTDFTHMPGMLSREVHLGHTF